MWFGRSPASAQGSTPPALDVKSFGAIGDDVTDDRAAIVSAINAASTAGRELYFSPGAYRITRDGGTAWCVDVQSSNVVMFGVPGKSIIKAASGMPDASVSLFRLDERTNVTIRGITFDGNWGNRVTEIAAGSHNVALPQGTIFVEDTTNMASSGTFTVRLEGDSFQYVSYTGKTRTTLTDCTGGTGTMIRHDPVVYENSAVGLNHTSQVDPKNHGLFKGYSRLSKRREERIQLRSQRANCRLATYKGIAQRTKVSSWPLCKALHNGHYVEYRLMCSQMIASESLPARQATDSLATST